MFYHCLKRNNYQSSINITHISNTTLLPKQHCFSFIHGQKITYINTASSFVEFSIPKVKHSSYNFLVSLLMVHFDIVFTIKMIPQIKLLTPDILSSLFLTIFLTHNHTFCSNPESTSIQSRSIFVLCQVKRLQITYIFIRLLRS